MSGVVTISRADARARWRLGRRVALIGAGSAAEPLWTSAATRWWGLQTFEVYELERTQQFGDGGTWVRPTREATNDDAAGFVYRREPFQIRHLRGAMARAGNLSRLGDLPPVERVKVGQAAREFGTALYIVWSYGTPIAWVAKGMEPYLPSVRYSITTTQHQHLIANALGVRFGVDGDVVPAHRGRGHSPYGPREGAR